MLVPNQLIKVKVIGCTLKHYKNLGYEVKMFDTIMVPPEHLTSGSKTVVDVVCDICGDKMKDLRRDRFLWSEGIKTLRIRSGILLPTEQELFDAIDYLVNTEHHFKEIILSDWKEKEEEECQEQLQVVL